MAALRVVDIETTGMAPPQAEVIELGMWDVLCQPDGSEARVSSTPGRSWLYRPERPCPPEVLAVHHILPEALELSDRFNHVSADVGMTMVTGAAPSAYVAHNAEFELQFLSGWSDPEYQSPAPPWICTYKGALRVWPEAPSHSNQSLMYWLGLHLFMDEEQRHPPHRALPDAYVTAHILVALLQRASLKDLLLWTTEPRLLPTCPIGKFRGRPWPEVEMGFLTWMLGVPDMEADLKWNARREIARRRDAQHLERA
jgi:exodeoxyribonuclease X